MKCQILFSGKNKKNNIILSSAENAQRVVKVKHHSERHFLLCILLPMKTFYLVYLPYRFAAIFTMGKIENIKK